MILVLILYKYLYLFNLVPSVSLLSFPWGRDLGNARGCQLFCYTPPSVVFTLIFSKEKQRL